jgi:hypothetical protein
VVTIALGLVGNLATNTVNVAGRWWPLTLWTAVAVLVVAVVVIEWPSSRSDAPVSSLGLDEWADGLAQGVQKLWRREEDHRRVHDPVALPMRWYPAADDLVDQWANIHRLPAGATAETLAVAGRIEQVAEVYRRIPSGRLVILGPAGAGKTILAARLTMDLLAARQPGEPVPVIVSVGSWNPTTTPLNTWLAGQLIRDHPDLAAPAQPGGSSRAAALITAGRILPILDGFDEIQPGLHQGALHHLNTTTDTPMVITSRLREYTAAVTGIDVLTAAAVIELAELTVVELAAYLPRTVAGHRTGLWDPVLARMRHESHALGPTMLRPVLTNPLMVFLARTIYSDTPGHDPRELLDTTRFATPEAIQDHLLAAFVPAVYQHHSGARRWDPDRAHHYLTYLAGHLHRAGTRDLAWWQLRDTIPRLNRTVVLALVLTLAAVLPFVFTIGLPLVLTAELAGGLAVGLAAGLPAVLAFARAAGLTSEPMFRLNRARPQPTPAPLQLHSRARHVFGWLPAGLAGGLASGLTFGHLLGLDREGPQPAQTRLQIYGRAGHVFGWLAVGLAGGLTVGLTVGLAGGFVFGPAFGLASGFAGGLAGGFAGALAVGLEAPTKSSDVVSASQSLATDRRNAIRKALTFVLAVGLAGGLGIGPAFGLAGGLMAGLLVGLGTSAWGHWLILVRVWLPLTGRLPWPVNAFLTDAYHRGVLRQTGAVYQFRHGRLQDHLTSPLPTEPS